jgi:predicted RNA-binding protein with PUA-like domain
MAPKKKSTTVATTGAERAPGEVRYWLFKSEPDVFSWDMQKARGVKGEPWTGVRNYMARNNMRAMQIGDLGFFYHSNIGKDVVGIVRVIALSHPDAEDDTGTWDCVDVEAVCDVPKPVGLADVKANAKLSKMALVTSMRLSVQPVTHEEWAEVCRMGEVLVPASPIPANPTARNRR